MPYAARLLLIVASCAVAGEPAPALTTTEIYAKTKDGVVLVETIPGRRGRVR